MLSLNIVIPGERELFCSREGRGTQTLLGSLYGLWPVRRSTMEQRSNLNGNIAYDDLREWLALAARLGEVREVKGASWQEDIGLASEAILRAENGPCVVFDEVPGCPKDFRVLLNMFAGQRRNMTLGFPDHLTKWELSDA